MSAVGGREGGDASSHLELSESGFKQLVIILMCLGFIFTGIFTSVLIFEELSLEGGYQRKECICLEPGFLLAWQR